MGGRRPSRISDVAGSSAKVMRIRRELSSAIKTKDAQKTLDSALRIASTDKALDNFAHAMSMLTPLYAQLKSQRKDLSDEQIHNIAVNAWDRIQKTQKVEVVPGFRRMVIESVKKSLRGGSREAKDN
jgi:hypothetical protein